MTTPAETALLRRFLRTVRVATGTALAEYELGEVRRLAAAPARFTALAAKGPAGWRFPEGGLASGDGLVEARVTRDPTGRITALCLQAVGSAGLSEWAGRKAVVSFGPLDPEAPATFDADGRAVIAIASADFSEDDLASFQLAPADAS